LPEPQDLQSEVGTISVVARYVPGEPEPDEIQSDDAFDEIVQSSLARRADFIRKALGDALGPDYTVTRLTIETTRSVEILAVVAVAYTLLKNVNEVVETLARARDHLVVITRWLLNRTPGPIHPWEYFVTGYVTTVPADSLAPGSSQIPLGYASPVQVQPTLPQPSGLVAQARQVATPRQPIEWDRNAFLSRLIVPLVFLFVVTGLIVALIAAFRLI
jgi:hypothetical protein